MAVSRPVAEIIVEIGQFKGGNARVKRIVQVCGGAAINSAVFELEFRESRLSQLQSVALRDVFKDQPCKISIVSRDGAAKVVHAGKITSGKAILRESGEIIEFESRLEHYLFGNPVDKIGCAVRPVSVSSKAEAEFYSEDIIDGPTVFNPRVDGVILPNQWVGDSAKLQLPIFIDPLSIHPDIMHFDMQISDENSGIIPHAATYWSLHTAVQYLCRYLNPKQTFVRNPTLFAQNEILPTSRDMLRDLEIPRGTRLPQALDMLLNPFGFGHYVEFEQAGPKIIIYRRGGRGQVAIDFPLQQIGEPVDDTLSSVWQYDLEFDLVESSANEIELVGDYWVGEGTFELIPGWSVDYDPSEGDTTDPNTLFTANAPGWDSNQGQRDAWRKWVLNEAGDYTNLRPTDPRPNSTQAFDVHKLFDDEASIFFFLVGDPPYLSSNVTRRQFLPTISLNHDGTPRGDSGTGVLVEYWQPETGQWINVQGIQEDDSEEPAGAIDGGGSVHVLRNEAGIYFANPNKFPEQLLQIAREHGIENCRVRVTASIRSDLRLRTIRRPADSLLADKKRVTIDLDSRYQFRSILRSSIFKDQVLDGTLLSSEVNDRFRLDKLGDELMDNWGHGTIGGDLLLDGIDFNLAGIRGKPVWGLRGRNVTFEVTAAGQLHQRYPTVEQIKFNVQEQTTTVTMQTFRGTTR